MDAAAELAARARRRRGLITLDDVDAVGLPRSTFYEWVDDGVYVRLQPGVYLAAAAVDGPLVRRHAAVLAAGRGAALSHMSAAHHYGLDGSWQPTRIDVLAAQRRKGVHSVRWHTAYEAAVILEHLGVPVTNGTRTVADVAAVIRRYEQFRKLGSDALRRRLTDERALRVQRSTMSGKRGVVFLDRFLDEFSPLLASTRNEFEAMFVRVTTAGGVPPTAMNHPVVDIRTRRRSIDAVYLPEHVPVELDGKAHHSLLLDITDDRMRERDVVLAGWRPFLRFSYWDLVKVPELVVVEIKTALDAARAGMRDRVVL